MSSEAPPTTNLFLVTREINEKLDTLLRRPTPPTEAELKRFDEALQATLAHQRAEATRLTEVVQTLLQPVTQFNEAALAQRLTAAIGEQLPTPAGLNQAGEQAGLAIQRAIQAAVSQATSSAQTISRQVLAEVQASVRQLTGAAEQTQRVAEQTQRVVAEAPQKATIDFFRTKRDVAIVLGIGAGLMLLVLVGLYGLCNGFNQVSQQKYLDLQREHDRYANALGVMEERRARLLRNHPELAYEYFPYANDPKPVVTPKAVPAAKKPAKKRR